MEVSGCETTLFVNIEIMKYKGESILPIYIWFETLELLNGPL